MDYTLGVALAGNELNKAAATLLRRMRGAMEAGDLTLSGSEDMANAIRDALVDLQKASNTFDHFARAPNLPAPTFN
jgi:hypothetical protein